MENASLGSSALKLDESALKRSSHVGHLSLSSSCCRTMARAASRCSAPEGEPAGFPGGVNGTVRVGRYLQTRPNHCQGHRHLTKWRHTTTRSMDVPKQT